MEKFPYWDSAKQGGAALLPTEGSSPGALPVLALPHAQLLHIAQHPLGSNTKSGLCTTDEGLLMADGKL